VLIWKPWSRAASPQAAAQARPSAEGPQVELAGAADSFLDLHRRAIAAFDLLSEASDEARRVWLQATALTDTALATEVAAMLTADRTGARRLPTVPAAPANDEALSHPPSVGPYRLVRRLGGGMGDVFLAERDDGLFEHTVAIKLIRGGRAMQRLSEHLFDERRILASLQHPNIAQLFGGGTTPEGLPFIVMEYLDGATITEHAAQRGLGLSERLRLFLTVCEAVQFAHQNLVVHADIKPPNIVMTAAGRVKLLDFGIAQWRDPQREGRAPFEGVMPMTRAYAAPERLAGGEPSVAADVYALGVLLYELLTGQLPHPAQAAERGEDVADLSATAPSIARAADPSPAVRAADLRVEVDAIVLKALAADPRRRYASVAELSQDLERYAFGLPVKALPDTWQYRSSRFVRRHRLGVGLTAAALIAATLVAVGTSLLYLQSERDRALADRRFGETRSMADYIINDVDLELADLPGTLPLRRLLVARSHGYLQALEKDHLASPALRLDIAHGYLRLARIYGLDVSGGVGDLPAARDSLRHARAILRTIAEVAPDNPRLVALSAEAALDAGTEIFVDPDAATLDKAMAELASAQALYGRYLQRNPSDIDAQLGLWRAQVMSARGYLYRREPAKALAIVTSNLGKANLPIHTREQAQNRDFIVNGSYLMLAENFEDTDPRLAFGYYEKLESNLEAVRRRGESNTQEDFLRTTALDGMAGTSATLGELDRAAAIYPKAIAEMQRLLSFGPNHEVSRNLVYVQNRLAGLYSRMGRAAEARQVSQAVIAGASADIAASPANTSSQRMLAIALQQRGAIERRAGDRAAACAADRQATVQWERTQRDKVALPMDLIPNGPIALLRAATAGDCGR
jgi:eukaryotic-like serine/threonine-protein kinase